MEQGRQKASLGHVARSSTDESGGLLIVETLGGIVLLIGIS